MKTIKKLILLAAVAAGVSFTAVSVDLPPGYQRVEYIQATGAQWIDTGYVPKANTRVECEVTVPAEQRSSWSAVFGTRPGGWGACDTAFGFFAR